MRLDDGLFGIKLQPRDGEGRLQRRVASETIISFLHTFRRCPGIKLRVTAAIDGAKPVLYEVLGSSGTEDEKDPVRSVGVRDNLSVPLTSLATGKHTLIIHAVDPGVVIDQILLPEGV